MQAFKSDDSDIGSPTDKRATIGTSNLLVGSQPVRDLIEQHGQQMKEADYSSHEADIPIVLPTGEQFHSAGEILSSIRPGHTLPVSGLEGVASRPSGKHSVSNNHTRRPAFWGRNNVSFHYYSNPKSFSVKDTLNLQAWLFMLLTLFMVFIPFLFQSTFAFLFIFVVLILVL